MRRIVFTVLALACVLSVRTSAQMPTPQRWENVEWYIVMSWQFAGADADTAATIFWDHMLPAMEQAWLGTTCLRVMTGKMGVACFGPMEEGLAGMEWEVSPNDIRFLELFFERAGEGAEDLFKTFGSGATGFEFNIALKHGGGM